MPWELTIRTWAKRASIETLEIRIMLWLRLVYSCALALLRVLFHLLNGLLDWPVYYDRLVGYYNGQADRLDWPSSIYRPGRSVRKSQYSTVIFPPEFRQPLERRWSTCFWSELMRGCTLKAWTKVRRKGDKRAICGLGFLLIGFLFRVSIACTMSSCFPPYPPTPWLLSNKIAEGGVRRHYMWLCLTHSNSLKQCNCSIDRKKRMIDWYKLDIVGGMAMLGIIPRWNHLESPHVMQPLIDQARLFSKSCALAQHLAFGNFDITQQSLDYLLYLPMMTIL